MRRTASRAHRNAPTTFTSSTRRSVSTSMSSTRPKRPVIPALIATASSAPNVVGPLPRTRRRRGASRATSARITSARRPAAVDVRGDPLRGVAVVRVRERDVVAGGGGAPRDGGADPAAGAGDEQRAASRYFATASTYAILRRERVEHVRPGVARRRLRAVLAQTRRRGARRPSNARRYVASSRPSPVSQTIALTNGSAYSSPVAPHTAIAAGGHHLEADEPERLLAAVREHDVGGGVERVQRRFVEERAHVHDRRIARAKRFANSRQSEPSYSSRQTARLPLARAPEHDVAVRLFSAAHDQARVDPRLAQLRRARRSPAASSCPDRSARLSRRSGARRTPRAAPRSARDRRRRAALRRSRSG